MPNLDNVAITVKILKSGDKILNVWQNELGYLIAVQRQNEEVIVYSVTLDENKNPRLNESYPLTVTFGNDEVESVVGQAGDSIKVTTF